MKKIVFALACFFGMAEANAQFQGPVTVRNLTDCEVCVAAVAACPDGTHYFSNYQFCIGPQQTQVIFNGIGWGAVVADPFTPPPCDDWEWQYAEISTRTGGAVDLWTNVGFSETTYPVPLEIFPDGTIETTVAIDQSGMGLDCSPWQAIHYTWGVDPQTGSTVIVIN